MSSTAPPQQNQPREFAIAAIRQALREIGDAGERLVQPDDAALRQNARQEQKQNLRPEKLQEMEKPSPRAPAERHVPRAPAERRVSLPAVPASEPGAQAPRGRPVVWSIVGLFALAGAGAGALGWHTSHEQETQADPVWTGSVSTAPRGPAERTVSQGEAARSDPEAQQSQAQLAAEAVAAAGATASDQAPLAREPATFEPAIDPLKAERTQTIRDNSDLADRLRVAQEMARKTTDSAEEFKSALAQITRQNADLAEELKAMRAQMARDNADFAERLKAGSEQMARLADQLKANQEQIARLTAVEQKPRPKPVASLPPAGNATPRKPPTASAPPSSQARAQTQDPRRLVQQPKPQ